MSRSSLLADTLTRIRNAQRVGHSFVVVSASTFIGSCLGVLESEGYISSFEKFEERAGVHFFKVALKYYRGRPVVSTIKMVSKPGCRAYTSVADMPRSKNGFGVYVVSTSRGVLSDRFARQKGIGGELLFEVS